MRRAKIVATIGPASQDEKTIQRLLAAGVDVARLNFSHGTHENHAAVYQRLRQAAKERGQAITILQDLQGPKIRTGAIADGQVTLLAGQTLKLTMQPVLGNHEIVSVDLPGLTESVRPGGRILLDDGNLELLVTAVNNEEVQTQVILPGILKPNKGVNLPGATIKIAGFTEKDRQDLAFGLELGVDAVAVSFVRTPDDIRQVRAAIQELAPHRKSMPVIAKLERPEALENLEQIIAIADGVMVARGDLGVEMSPEAVPIAQKQIIECANRCAKVVITATQMLESMITRPRPTRAEASDVANAIFDGTDAVMLSGETAAGQYPIEAVRMMDAIVSEAEVHTHRWSRWQGNVEAQTSKDDTYYMTQAVREMAHDRDVAAIVAFTMSGRTALMLSKARPIIPILAFTPEQDTYCRLGMYWGVTPFLVEQVNTLEDILLAVDKTMVARSIIEPGQQVVVTCGYPVTCTCPTNLALLYTVQSGA
jgi:pyruvate kinase